ncbi:MAG: hypothetical protein RLZ82_94 [Actinomycetota bacterium]|jgi:hypothetical protein
MFNSGYAVWGDNVNCQECRMPNQVWASHCSACGVKLIASEDAGSEDSVRTPMKLHEISPSNPLEVKGYNGQILFDGKLIAISRKGAVGFLTQGLKGTKEIPLRAISSIQLKKAGMLTNGYIQFATGAGESKGGIQAAVKDENSVIFTIDSNDEFAELKDLLTQAIHEPGSSGNSSKSTASSAEQLEKLAKLLEQGLLTKAEFMAEKKRILG